MTRKKVLGSLSSNSSLECRICGDVARGLNFDVMTCMPCKSFFRKNAFKQPKMTCELENNCNITKLTRSFCSPCRLKKCLKLGMDPKLIRRIPQANTISNKTRKPPKTKHEQTTLPTPLPLDLLRNDRSTLTNHEWTLLSNCIYTYDQQNMCSQIQYYLNQLVSLPPQLRLRRSDAYNIVGQFYVGIQPLIEHSPDLHSLPADARRAITKHNLHSIGAINGIFICREMDLLRNSLFLNPCNIHYGSEFMIECTRNSTRCDPNGNLIKMMLFVLTFSGNCSIVTFNEQEPLETMSYSINLISIQNVYVTMVWKYLVYLYGFKEAVVRFSYIIKNIVDIIHMLEMMPKNETHDHMIETIVTETERVLLIKN